MVMRFVAALNVNEARPSVGIGTLAPDVRGHISPLRTQVSPVSLAKASRLLNRIQYVPLEPSSPRVLSRCQPLIYRQHIAQVPTLAP